jgi:hypothetical protein
VRRTQLLVGGAVIAGSIANLCLITIARDRTTLHALCDLVIRRARIGGAVAKFGDVAVAPSRTARVGGWPFQILRTCGVLTVTGVRHIAHPGGRSARDP